MDGRLLGNLCHALAVRRAHPQADIRLSGLTVRTHRSVPSGPLEVETVRLERRHQTWQKGSSKASSHLSTKRDVAAFISR